MNLVLDFGNTLIKAAFFEGTKLIEDRRFSSVSDVLRSLESFPVARHCLIASVTAKHKKVQAALSKNCNTRLFTPETPVPIKNLYLSPLSLGSDRLASAAGAAQEFPDRDLLVIDAGTCLKFNFVNKRREFIGGAISPGIAMRLKAMHQFTHALPEPELPEEYLTLTGKSTSESLLSGAIVGAACEADDMATRYRQIYPEVQVILTGGDARYLSPLLKNAFFADQNLILKGLNAILEYNLAKN
jgi:type III pantothenate kinase